MGMQDKMPLQSVPNNNLFGLEGQSYESSKVIVLPVPYDSTVTYKTGAREGPQAIINASRNIELYSYEVGADLSKIGIYTLQAMEPDFSSPENMLSKIAKEVSIILDDKKVPVLLGGEHTITIGALQALKGRKNDMSILHFDAHSDTRQELFGSKYMHATVVTRAREIFPDIFHVGLRSVDADYALRMNKEKTLFIDEIHELGLSEAISKIMDGTNDNIYVSVDLDVLDSGEMPSVGTPEPNGLHFSEIAQIFKEIGNKKNLCGMDFTELCPIPYLHAPDYLAAKLIYLAIGFFLSERG
ncbi:MAG: agmatinase [Candidatus Micrarchaeales archaeon]|jgi:agmatinase